MARQLTALSQEGRSRFLFAALGSQAAQELATALLPVPAEEPKHSKGKEQEK